MDSMSSFTLETSKQSQSQRVWQDLGDASSAPQEWLHEAMRGLTAENSGGGMVFLISREKVGSNHSVRPKPPAAKEVERDWPEIGPIFP